MNQSAISPEAVYIVSGARTPMGGFQGAFTNLSAVVLGAAAIKEAVSRGGVGADQIQEVIMGNVLSAGLKQGPARQAALQAGLPAATGCTTVNKLCGSGMKATMLAHDLIKAGTNDIMISGGMESMSNAPYILPNARAGMRMGHGQVMDHMFMDGLEDAETGSLMGQFAQSTADEHGLTREEMDDFSIESLNRAQNAISEGYFAEEVVPVTLKTRKGETQVLEDEQPGNAKLDKIRQLRAAFKKDGTITAANASSISDGASALLLMSGTEVQKRGITPLARIYGHATHSQHPSEFTLAPIGALNTLLEKVSWSAEDVDLYEINEAFAMVTMLAMRSLNLPHEKVNIHGGACALGHPVGSTGSRIILTLIYALKRLNKRRGVAALCIGGGEANAVALEIV